MERIKSDYKAGYIAPRSLNHEALETILSHLALCVTEIGRVNCKLDDYASESLLYFSKTAITFARSAWKSIESVPLKRSKFAPML